MKKPQKMTVEQIAKIKEMHANGMTAYAIAKRLSIPPGVAKYHIDREKMKSAVTHNNASNIIAPNVESLLLEIERLRMRNEMLLDIITENLRG